MSHLNISNEFVVKSKANKKATLKVAFAFIERCIASLTNNP